MIKNSNDILYNRLKNRAGFHRSKKFKKWFHEQYPNYEMHHLFGSYTGKKTSDYLCVPVDRSHHKEAEKDKSNFAIEYLHKLHEVLVAYIIFLENKK